MSITLGDYTVETKKTVGELPANSDNIIAEAPCDDTINLATVQPVWKKIAQFDLGTQFSNFDPITGNEIIRRDIMTGSYIDLSPSLGKILQNGYDYKVKLNWTFGGLTPANGQMRFCYDYNAPSGINLYNLGGFSSGAEVHLSEDGCSGDYGTGSQLLDFTYTDITGIPFNITIELELYQLCTAKWNIELCGGGILSHSADVEFESVQEQVLYTDNPEVEPIITTKTVSKRKTTYDPYGMGFAEIAKLPTTCLGYSVYYESNIRQGDYFGTPWIPYKYWIDDTTKKININTTFVPSQIREYRLYEGGLLKFSGNSDASNLLDWTDWVPSLLDKNLEFQVWESGAPVTLVGNITIKLQYDFTEYDCPCNDCGNDCGGITIIFHQSCGNAYPLKFSLMVQDGKYNIEGETFTQGGGIIRPITKIKATYDLVLSEYSDETYLLLMELIADNILIEVVDNIDVSSPTTEYYIDTDSLTPTWNFNSKLGTIVIPVIRKDTIRTSRRNCCN